MPPDPNFCPDRTPNGYPTHLWIWDQDLLLCTYCSISRKDVKAVTTAANPKTDPGPPWAEREEWN